MQTVCRSVTEKAVTRPHCSKSEEYKEQQVSPTSPPTLCVAQTGTVGLLPAEIARIFLVVVVKAVVVESGMLEMLEALHADT